MEHSSVKAPTGGRGASRIAPSIRVDHAGCAGGLVQRRGWRSPKPQVGVRFPGPPLRRSTARHARRSSPPPRPPVIEAVVFDLDGVLVDSEQAWDGARRGLVEERGRTWTEGAEIDMLGMSSREWPVYLRDRLGVDMEPADISADV